MRSLFRSIVVVLALILAALPIVPLRAQMPPARYTPNVDLTNAAYLRAVVRLPSGKVVVAGGDLQRVGGVRQSYLARLNADGSLDTSWNPAPNYGVGALWVDAAGMLYVGGSFSSIAGQPRAGLARFNAAGVLDPNWAPTLNGGVNAIAAGLPGSVCFGGIFTQVNGFTHNRLACVSDIDGSLIAGFAPDVNDTVGSLVSSGNNLYVGGYFTSISATPRNAAARLALNGSGVPDTWNPAPGGVVLSFLPTGSGEVYLAGFFSFVGVTSRPGVAKVNDTNGAVITAFNAQMACSNYALDVCSDGAGGIVAVGSFSAIGGQPRHNVARLDGATGNAIAGFDPGIDYGYALHVLAEPGGSYLVGGPFSSLGGGEHLALGPRARQRQRRCGVRSEPGGARLCLRDCAVASRRLDLSSAAASCAPTDSSAATCSSFLRPAASIRTGLPTRPTKCVRSPSTISAVSMSADISTASAAMTAHILRACRTPRTAQSIRPGIRNPMARFSRPCCGRRGCTSADPSARSAAARRRRSHDCRSLPAMSIPAGSPRFTGGGIGSMAINAGGDMLVIGSFTTVNGVPRAGAAKLATGASATLDPTWAPAFGGGSPGTLAVDGDDVYVAGTFSSVNGMPRAGFARVSASGAGALDPAWTPSANNQAAKLLPQPEGIYVAGYFSSINASGHGYLARLDKVTGAIDSTWASSADNWVLDLLPYYGSIVTVGWFSSMGGQLRQALARLPVAGDTIFVDDFSG